MFIACLYLATDCGLFTLLSPSAVFEIKMEDRGKFFDALTALSAV